MLQRLYEALYKRLGGRPFTHIAREGIQHRPLEWLMVFLFLGIGIGDLTSGTLFWTGLGFLVAGVVIGHIWWGGSNWGGQAKRRRRR